MKKRFLLSAAGTFLSLHFSSYASEYLCEPKIATGVVVKNDNWQQSEFSVGKAKYKISRSSPEYNYSVTDISKTKCELDSKGDDTCLTPILAICLEGFQESGLLDCEMPILENNTYKKTGTHIFSFDKRSMRFMHYPVKYSGFLFGKDDSYPFIEIGSCLNL
jgi:hypothetical protein